MKRNNYWSKYKKEFKASWHFDQNKITKKDFQFIGNIKADYKKIQSKICLVEKKIKPKYAVDYDEKLKKAKLDLRIKAFKTWGYKKTQTEYIQIFSNDYPDLFKKFIKISNLDLATSSIIKQYPGNIIPWHYDTHVTFKNLLKKKNINNKKIIRYMVFLTDWDWGHYFCVGNSIAHQWKAGDIITWEPHIHHCGSNSGMSPKITLNITGLINKNSIHLTKKKSNMKLIL
jgi:hypothetical protein